MGVAALAPINDKLLHAAKVGNLIDVTTCLADSKVNLECTDENKYTPLFWACMNGHSVVVDLLLEKKASTACQNLNKQGPLHIAATKGYIDIVESLLENGADPNALSVFGRVPLHNAVINGHSKLAKLMVDKGVDIYAADDDGKTAIHMACEKGLLDVVKHMVKKGADVELFDNGKNNSLFFAAMSGSLELVQFVAEQFKSKVDLGMINNSKGKTAGEYGTKEIRAYLNATVKEAAATKTKEGLERRTSQINMLKAQAEDKQNRRKESKAAAGLREAQVIGVLTAELHQQYVKGKVYLKQLKYDELTKASVVALNSRDIPGMNRLIDERDQLNYFPTDGYTAAVMREELIQLSLSLEERRTVIEQQKDNEESLAICKEYQKKVQKLINAGGKVNEVVMEEGEGTEKKTLRSQSINVLAKDDYQGLPGEERLAYPRLVITSEDTAYLRNLSSARRPSSPRSSNKEKLSSSGKEAVPAVTDKIQIKDIAFWKKDTFESASSQKANVVLSLDIEQLQSEYSIMGVMHAAGGGIMKRRIAEPLGFFTAADAETGLKGSSSLEGYGAMALERWKTTMESYMNKERKAGRWTMAVAAKAADQFAEMVELSHKVGYVLMGLKASSVGVFVDSTTGETELKCIDVKGVFSSTEEVAVETYQAQAPPGCLLFMAPEIARFNHPPPIPVELRKEETWEEKAKREADVLIAAQVTVNKKKSAKDKEQEKAKTAAELERRDIKLVLANLWTAGMLLWTMFDSKGQHMLSRCCKLDNTSPDEEILKKLNSLTQQDVDGYLEKCFGKPEETALKQTLKGFLQVDPKLRASIDKARKKGAFVAESSLASSFKF